MCLFIVKVTLKVSWVVVFRLYVVKIVLLYWIQPHIVSGEGSWSNDLLIQDITVSKVFKEELEWLPCKAIPKNKWVFFTYLLIKELRDILVW